ncbi:MAG: DUF4870 domain-containing protein [Natronomonas sp.]
MVPDANEENEIGEESDDGEADVDDLPYEVSSDDRTWGILTHAAAFVGFVIPFGNILGPLLVWAIKKDESQFVDDNGKQALNFQITWSILLIVSALSIFVAIGVVLLPIVGLAWLILVIIAIIRASNDEVYDYPLTMEIIT